MLSPQTTLEVKKLRDVQVELFTKYSDRSSVCYRAFTASHKAPLNIATNSKVLCNATQVEM